MCLQQALEDGIKALVSRWQKAVAKDGDLAGKWCL
jgi:hypothetical protein